MWSDGWIAFDTETTGLGPSARIVEIAVVVFEKNEPVHEWSRLLCPENVDWNDAQVQGALAVNQIKTADLKGQPTFADVLPDLLLELGHHVWVAHNASFDVRMINQEMRRLGRPVLSPPLLLCTRDLAIHLGGPPKGNKLGDVAARFNVKQDGEHRAAVDATVCGRVLAAMVQTGKLPANDAAIAALVRKNGASRRRYN